jgi:hypothetical protein
MSGIMNWRGGHRVADGIAGTGGWQCRSACGQGWCIRLDEQSHVRVIPSSAGDPLRGADRPRTRAIRAWGSKAPSSEDDLHRLQELRTQGLSYVKIAGMCQGFETTLDEKLLSNVRR